MTESRRHQLVLATLLMLGGIVFFTGDGWGLPSRAGDAQLFGAADRAWSGAEILQKGGAWTPDPKRAADADTGPALDRQRLQWLNQTEKQQAEIIRRYRLYPVLVQHYSAAAAFRQTIAIAPDYPMGHRGLGEILLYQGQLDEALAELRRAAELAPQDPAAHIALAKALSAKGLTAEAQDEMQKAQRAHPR
jgi:tetratricopeptide (TPR) repeat protein